MSEIYIFSGTTEGRELSEFLAQKKICHTVFVATEYGKTVMKESPFARVREGRLTENDMRILFEKKRPGLVLDATHPYAAEVSANIRKALQGIGRYVRIERNLSESEDLLAETALKTKVTLVSSAEEAAAYLRKTRGICLLTTGVKTLKAYTADKQLKKRLAVRILPSAQSLSLALEAGIEPRQIAAMEGPFTCAMNEAMIDYFHADIVVTKNSGIRGGFSEKAQACAHRKKELVVILPERAGETEGERSYETMTVLQAKALFAETEQKLVIVGIGAGDDKSMTLEACRKIREADLLIGASRMLEAAGRINPKAEKVKEYSAAAVLERIREYGYEKNVYLVSGDTGFFSGAAAFEQGDACKGISIQILPGISSISYLCAALGIPYSDTRLLSSHGKELDVRAIAGRHESFFAITSGKNDFNEMIRTVIEMHSEAEEKRPMVICEGYNLGMADQRVRKYSPEQFVPAAEEGLYVAGVLYDR